MVILYPQWESRDTAHAQPQHCHGPLCTAKRPTYKIAIKGRYWRPIPVPVCTVRLYRPSIQHGSCGQSTRTHPYRRPCTPCFFRKQTGRMDRATVQTGRTPHSFALQYLLIYCGLLAQWRNNYLITWQVTLRDVVSYPFARGWPVSVNYWQHWPMSANTRNKMAAVKPEVEISWAAQQIQMKLW